MWGTVVLTCPSCVAKPNVIRTCWTYYACMSWSQIQSYLLVQKGGSVAVCVSCNWVSTEWMCEPVFVLVFVSETNYSWCLALVSLSSKPHLTAKDRQNDLGAKDHQKGLEMVYPSTIPTISQEVRATWEGGGPCNVKRPIAWDGEGQSPERLIKPAHFGETLHLNTCILSNLKQQIPTVNRS